MRLKTLVAVLVPDNLIAIRFKKKTLAAVFFSIVTSALCADSIGLIFHLFRQSRKLTVIFSQAGQSIDRG